MDETERQAIRVRQEREIYEAIGRFAVMFERVVATMAMTITTAPTLHSRRFQPIDRAALTKKTAGAVFKKFCKVVAECRAGFTGERDAEIMANVFGRLDRLIKDRNNVLHRHWYVGWGSESDTDFSRVSGHAFGAAGTPDNPALLDYTAAEFNALTVRAEELAGIVMGVQAHIMSGSAFTLWRFHENGDVFMPGRVSFLG